MQVALPLWITKKKNSVEKEILGGPIARDTNKAILHSLLRFDNFLVNFT